MISNLWSSPRNENAGPPAEGEKKTVRTATANEIPLQCCPWFPAQSFEDPCDFPCGQSWEVHFWLFVINPSWFYLVEASGKILGPGSWLPYRGSLVLVLHTGMRKRKTLLWDADAGVSISAEFTASGPVTYHGVEHPVGQSCWPSQKPRSKERKGESGPGHPSSTRPQFVMGSITTRWCQPLVIEF